MLYIGFLIVLFLFSDLINSAKDTAQLSFLLQTYAISTGLILFLITLLQYRINASAMSIVGGRFHGLTSNPQMFVISLAPFFPVAYFTYSQSKSPWVRLLSVGATLLSLYWCYLTGSRLSLVLIFMGYAMMATSKISTALSYAFAA